VLFGLLSFIASFLATAGTAGEQIGVSHPAAAFLPPLWVALFGTIGAARQAYGRNWWHWLCDAMDRRLHGAAAALSGALAGARTGLGLGLAAVVIALLVAAVRTPQGTDIRAILGVLLLALLTLPNLVSWAILAGMGATLALTGSFLTSGTSTSVGIFGGAATGTDHIGVSRYWLLLILIPLAATVRAGFVAAHQSADQPKAAVRAALCAGGLLVAGCWLVAWISSGHMQGLGISASLTTSSVAALFLPPLWGIGGAWLGALLYLGQRQRPLTRPNANPTTNTPTWPASPGQPDPHPVLCPNCRTANDEGSDYCEGCGMRLTTTV
jgi:hypothetical protein